MAYEVNEEYEQAKEDLKPEFQDEEVEEVKELNQARFTSFGAYKALYDCEPVEGTKHVWRGRVMMEPCLDKMHGAKEKIKTGWLFFSREYVAEHTWDLVYHEIEFDEQLFGVPFILVPKEKFLFAYDPAPKEGILLPDSNIKFPGRGGA